MFKEIRILCQFSLLNNYILIFCKTANITEKTKIILTCLNFKKETIFSDTNSTFPSTVTTNKKPSNAYKYIYIAMLLKL